MTSPPLVPSIQDDENIYELTRVEDPLGNHFIAHGQIVINPNVFYRLTLSGLEELDQDNLTTLVHPQFLRTQPDRFGKPMISFPVNSKLDVFIHVIKVIDDDTINNANDNVKDKIRDKKGWIACSTYEVIGKSCENNSDPVSVAISL